ncbi:helix-turn-helix domain-containing protein [Mucilaginibacter panaciglaebae]|uniref:HTH araC/xylS-type domain-containing protein n=1 Tax=Mucilaginibacter panaciglaebae TaxID=502331 RepID=A0ABP7WFB0_9SPHI
MVTEERLAPLMAYWDKNLVCRFANQAYLDWFGYSPGQIINKLNIQELLGWAYQLNQHLNGSTQICDIQTFERMLRNAHGARRKVLVAYYPDCGNGIIEGFFIYVVDVTDASSLRVEKAIYEVQVMVDHQKMTENDGDSKIDKKMFEVAETLKQNILGKFPGLNKLADQHFISVSKLKRDFKQFYNMSPYAFFHDLKMIYAENYMKSYKCSKKEMAAMLEFSNPAAFYSAFKKFRQQRKNADQLTVNIRE